MPNHFIENQDPTLMSIVHFIISLNINNIAIWYPILKRLSGSLWFLFFSPMPYIILLPSKLKYRVLKTLKMLVYNIYTYASIGFKVIISSIYEVLLHTSSSSMFKSMIFVHFNTNIVTILYFQYIPSFKTYLIILQLLSWI